MSETFDYSSAQDNVVGIRRWAEAHPYSVPAARYLTTVRHLAWLATHNDPDRGGKVLFTMEIPDVGEPDISDGDGLDAALDEAMKLVNHEPDNQPE